jgi:hypothetical protein
MSVIILFNLNYSLQNEFFKNLLQSIDLLLVYNFQCVLFLPFWAQGLILAKKAIDQGYLFAHRLC